MDAMPRNLGLKSEERNSRKGGLPEISDRQKDNLKRQECRTGGKKQRRKDGQPEKPDSRDG